MGGDPNNYHLTYKGTEEAGLVGLYLSQQGDLGNMNVRIYLNSVAFHASACFDEFPKLRRAGKVDCHIEPATDENGNPCLTVHVKPGSPNHSVKRSQRQAEQGRNTTTTQTQVPCVPEPLKHRAFGYRSP